MFTKKSIVINIAKVTIVLRKNLTASFFLPSKYSFTGSKKNIYPMNAAESVSREIIIIGTIYCPTPVFIEVSVTRVMPNTITTMYISAKRAFRYGFLFISRC